METTGPTLLGFNVLTVATMLSAVAVAALIFALYMATTVRDPMARRVKALNERREQLKAGITASRTKRRSAIATSNAATDRMRGVLNKLKVLQESQLQQAQTALLQAGIRSKDAAVAVIFGRMVLPIAVGAFMFGIVYGFVAAILLAIMMVVVAIYLVGGAFIDPDESREGFGGMKPLGERPAGGR